MAKGTKPRNAADALAEAALWRFGQRLDKRQQGKLRSTARKLQRNAETLRRYLLANGDEPATRFGVGVEDR